MRHLPILPASPHIALPCEIRTGSFVLCQDAWAWVYQENYNNLRPTSDSTEYSGVSPFFLVREAS